jgi:HAE1 family hydrophobic/amphiphilic exporter-1
MLMGIVAKNSILLVDSAIVARSTRRLFCHAAITEAVRKRARPIVMTTVAMCAIMARIAFGAGADSEFRSPMALVVIGGPRDVDLAEPGLRARRLQLCAGTSGGYQTAFPPP